jgi:hypothetical protein
MAWGKPQHTNDTHKSTIISSMWYKRNANMTRLRVYQDHHWAHNNQDIQAYGDNI